MSTRRCSDFGFDFARPISISISVAVAVVALAGGCGDAESAAPARPGGSAGSAPSGTAAPSAPATADLVARGERIYGSLCLTCHQADGGGVPNLQPPLAGSSAVNGDPAYVIDTILRGVGGGGIALESSGEWFQAMGGYRQLPDTDIAAVATYIRQAWGNEAAAVTPEQVATRRATLPAG